MEQTTDFRVHLSSRVKGRNNRPCEFITQLPERVQLEGLDWEVGLEAFHYLHSWPNDVTDLNGIYVYTDIIDHTYVGDTKAPCLAYVPVLTKKDEMGHYSCNPPQYHHVRASCIHTIEIDLRTYEGKPVPMAADKGETVAILHFHRKFKVE